jgi:hypothetical protein
MIWVVRQAMSWTGLIWWKEKRISKLNPVNPVNPVRNFVFCGATEEHLTGLTGFTGLRTKSVWHDLGGSSGDELDRIDLVEGKED